METQIPNGSQWPLESSFASIVQGSIVALEFILGLPFLFIAAFLKIQEKKLLRKSDEKIEEMEEIEIDKDERIFVSKK